MTSELNLVQDQGVGQRLQNEFDAKYITSNEICEYVGVERSSLLHARRRGMLPCPINIRGVKTFVWDREFITPYLNAWKLSIASRKGELVNKEK